MTRGKRLPSLLVLLLAAPVTAATLSLGPPASPRGGQPVLVNDALQISAAMARLGRKAPWKPASSEETARGPAAAVYPLVAPATVVVCSTNGHGTGILIDPEGWVLTNHHVIEAAAVDEKTLTRRPVVYMGRLKDDFMQVIDEPVAAVVYKISQQKDLALLKLTLPKGMKTFPAIKLAARVPRPGTDCVVLGHPAAGMLWTVRSGEIAGAGTWPHEMIDVVMERLFLTGADRDRLKTLCDQAPQRKVVISSCGLNPGDSGGPLVNLQGELIALNFAIPNSDEERGIHLDKFSYHVHLDEIRAFLRDRPKTPPICVPDAWPAGLYMRLGDVDGDGVPDTLVFSMTKGGKPTGMLFDLNQVSRLKDTPEAMADFKKDDWHFQCAVQFVPEDRVFYDTRNSGRIDLILIDKDHDGTASRELRCTGDTWTSVKPASKEVLDPSRFTDKKLRARLEQFIRILSEEKSKEAAGPKKPAGPAAPKPEADDDDEK